MPWGFLGGPGAPCNLLIKPGLIISRFDGLIGSPGKSQKEGQEDQGEIKEIGGPPLIVLRSPGPPGLPSGSSLGSLTIHQTSLRRALLQKFSRVQSNLLLKC